MGGLTDPKPQTQKVRFKKLLGNPQDTPRPAERASSSTGAAEQIPSELLPAAFWLPGSR